MGRRPNSYPDAPCMDYLPTLGEKWPHSRGNVGKYSLHGAYGIYEWCFFFSPIPDFTNRTPSKNPKGSGISFWMGLSFVSFALEIFHLSKGVLCHPILTTIFGWLQPTRFGKWMDEVHVADRHDDPTLPATTDRPKSWHRQAEGLGKTPGMVRPQRCLPFDRVPSWCIGCCCSSLGRVDIQKQLSTLDIQIITPWEGVLGRFGGSKHLLRRCLDV